jgi:ATP-binding cassette subfamily A (ABC1) protein 3
MTRSSAACNDAALTALVHKHIPHASLLSSAGGELAFQLPLSHKGAFAQLFQELEQKKKELHIGGYGVSMTTLEEVFLRLASDSITTPDEESSAHFVNEPASHKVQHENQGGKFFKRDVVIPVSSSSLQSSSFTRAYGQMLLKRVLIARRDWKV